MSRNVLFGRIFDIVFILTILYLVAIKNTYAYLDPGSGSYLLQMIAAGLLSSIFVIKKFWRNIKEFVSSLLRATSGKKNR